MGYEITLSNESSHEPTKFSKVSAKLNVTSLSIKIDIVLSKTFVQHNDSKVQYNWARNKFT